MADMNATATGVTAPYSSGWTCPNCGGWVDSYSAAAHYCQPPASPLFPDPRLFALQEQIAKALERIADALEGLKKPSMCGEEYDSISGVKWICTRDAGHDQATGHTSSPHDLLRFK